MSFGAKQVERDFRGTANFINNSNSNSPSLTNSAASNDDSSKPSTNKNSRVSMTQPMEPISERDEHSVDQTL